MTVRCALALSVILISAAAAPVPAFAWNCVATSSDGAQGWSENYPTVKAAERRALQECEKVTTSYDCEVQQCVPAGGS